MNPDQAKAAVVVECEGLARTLFDYHKSGKPVPFGPMASWDETTDAVRERYRKQAAALMDAVRAGVPSPTSAESSRLGEGEREALGRIVRDEWMAWAREQPNPKASWLVPWEELSEPDREVDRRIGERIKRLSASPGVAGDAIGPLESWEVEAIDDACEVLEMAGLHALPEYQALKAAHKREAAALGTVQRG